MARSVVQGTSICAAGSNSHIAPGGLYFVISQHSSDPVQIIDLPVDCTNQYASESSLWTHTKEKATSISDIRFGASMAIDCVFAMSPICLWFDMLESI